MKKQSKIKLDYHCSNYKNTSLSQNKNFHNNVIKKRRRIFFLILLFLCLVVNLYFLFFSSYFDIQNFEISKTQNIPKEKIKKIALDQFKQKRFFFFNQKNLFIFNKKTLQNNLNQAYNLSKLKIHKEFKNPLWTPTIKIDLKEKISTLIWITKDDKCYFLDEKGMALEEINLENKITINNEAQNLNKNIKNINDLENIAHCNPENLFKKFKKFPIIYNETDEKVEIKKTIISEKLIQSILFLYKELPLKTKIEINYFKIPILKKLDLTKEEKIKEENPAIQDIDGHQDKKTILQQPIISKNNLEDEYKKLEKTEIRVVVKEGFEIYFDIFFSDLDQQINNLRKILNQEIKDKLSSLEYIDLRFGNRIYYKVKE
ncbi:MAG: hypothetical protein ABH808_03735 [Candidatus Kuenenbacteria bacterium]